MHHPHPAFRHGLCCQQHPALLPAVTPPPPCVPFIPFITPFNYLFFYSAALGAAVPLSSALLECAAASSARTSTQLSKGIRNVSHYFPPFYLLNPPQFRHLTLPYSPPAARSITGLRLRVAAPRAHVLLSRSLQSSHAAANNGSYVTCDSSASLLLRVQLSLPPPFAHQLILGSNYYLQRNLKPPTTASASFASA